MNRLDISAAALLAALGCGVATPALAQQRDEQFARDRNVSVRDRPKPEYDAVGIRMGSFRLYPELIVAAEHNDNVFAVDTNEEEDVVINVDPQLALRSDFANHELNFLLAAPSRFYQEFDDQSTTDVTAAVDGRLDVYRDFAIFGSLGYGDLSEAQSSSPSSLALAEPVEYTETRAELGLSKVFNRVRFSMDGVYEVTDFSDGVLVPNIPFDQDYRDRTLTEAGVRLDYAVSPSTSLFISARGNQRDYDLEPPVVLSEHDSKGYEVLVGANFDVTRLITGEIGVGYLEQEYEDPTAETTTGLAVRANLDWYVDELVTVSFGAAREVEDSGVINAPAYVASNASISLDYELRRNIIVGVRYDYSFDEYEGIDREDTRWNGVFQLDYALNRGVSLFAEAGHYEQLSEGLQPGREYVINRGLIGIKLRR